MTLKHKAGTVGSARVDKVTLGIPSDPGLPVKKERYFGSMREGLMILL
jgi:hypothetical protein